VAGGAGKNELKVFKNSNEYKEAFRIQMEIKELSSNVQTIDTNPTQKQFAFGCKNSSMYIINYGIDENF
jgi:hypothetical protein